VSYFHRAISPLPKAIRPEPNTTPVSHRSAMADHHGRPSAARSVETLGCVGAHCWHPPPARLGTPPISLRHHPLSRIAPMMLVTGIKMAVIPAAI
jgi:hypothetical protein